MRALRAVVVFCILEPGVAAQSGSGPGPAARRESRPADAPGTAVGPAIAIRSDRVRVAHEATAILPGQSVSWHNPEKKKGGLDLTRRASAVAGGETGPVIVPGQPAESLLVEKVTGGEMPPKGPLSVEHVTTIRAWVEAGAP